MGLADEDLIGRVQQHKNSIFVTHNTRDVWRRVDGRPRICIVCLDIGSDPDAETVSDLLRSVLRAAPFRTARARSHLVIRVTSGKAQW